MLYKQCYLNIYGIAKKNLLNPLLLNEKLYKGQECVELVPGIVDCIWRN